MDIKKEEGFDGEKRIMIPPIVIGQYKSKSLCKQFHITDIGYYPKALHHFCKRINGCEEHIFIHCTDGKGVVIVNNKRYNLNANEYIVIPSGVKHFYKADDKLPWTIYWMHFGGELATSVAKKLFKKLVKQNNILVMAEEQIRLFEKIYSLLSQGYAKDSFEYIALTLPYFFSAYLYPEKFSVSKEPSEDDIIEKSIAFLKNNISRKIGLKEVSDHVFLSISHFSKLFKNRTGYSPIEYLNHLKIQRACYLLQFSDKRISEISFDVGFEDQYYFSRLFKEHMGVSPSSHRKNLDKGE